MQIRELLKTHLWNTNSNASRTKARKNHGIHVIRCGDPENDDRHNQLGHAPETLER